MTRRSRIVGFGSAALLVVAGIACAFAFSGTLGQNLAFVLVALGLVLGTALVFAEVGFSEDRERAREAETKRRPKPASDRSSGRAGAKHGDGAAQRGRRRPDRIRAHLRRPHQPPGG